MAWRPTEYLIEGELDNTTPGKVTGWVRFAGMDETVMFDLKGNCHRDIRGARIRLSGNSRQDDPEAASYMDGFASKQAGEVGDITAGLPPQDYVDYPYIEWFSEANGRVVIELNLGEVEVLTRPIPACESDPIPRESQQRKMAAFMHELSSKMQVPAIAIDGASRLISDPTFSHWVVVNDRIIGEARDVEADGHDVSIAFVRLFHAPEFAEFGSIRNHHLRVKDSV